MKRDFRKGILVVIMSALAVSITFAGGKAETIEEPATEEFVQGEEFNWRRFEGEKIRVLTLEYMSAPIKKMVPEFEEATGIKVNMEIVANFELYPKVLLEFVADPAGMDVFFLSFENLGYKLLKENWLMDMTPYITDPTMTAPDWDWGDFLKPNREVATQKGQVIGIPFYTHVEFMVYRKDLFDEKGLTYADVDTYDDFKRTAAMFHDPGNEFYGVTYRGQGVPASWIFSYWMWAYGGDWLGQDGKPNINSPNVVKAATMYGDILRKYGPPGPTDLDDGRNKALFSEGKVAMWLAYAGHFGSLNDPEISKVAGKLGFCPQPAGPEGRFTTVTPALWSISSGSKHKGASWYFAQWISTKEAQLNIQRETNMFMSRQSAWEDPLFLEKIANDFPGFIDAAYTSFEASRVPALPPAEDVGAIRAVVGEALEVAINGGDVKAAFERANKQYAELMDKPMK